MGKSRNRKITDIVTSLIKITNEKKGRSLRIVPPSLSHIPEFKTETISPYLTCSSIAHTPDIKNEAISLYLTSSHPHIPEIKR